MEDEPWYAVRCVFEHPDEDPASGEHWYEERVTIWRAESDDEALALAEAEADLYAEANGCENLGLAQGFHIAAGSVGMGTEAFSLIRGSRLEADDYLDAFFDTGTELERDQDGDEPPTTS